MKELHIYNENGLRAIQPINKITDSELKKIIKLLKSLGDLRFEIKEVER